MSYALTAIGKNTIVASSSSGKTLVSGTSYGSPILSGAATYYHGASEMKEHTCIKDDGGTPNRRCRACDAEKDSEKKDQLDSTPDVDTDHMLKQQLAAPARYYGGGGTIHGTGHVSVETDKDGNVVSVWFRCCPLPFKQSKVDTNRADEDAPDVQRTSQ
jgi:hypothetical protein